MVTTKDKATSAAPVSPHDIEVWLERFAPCSAEFDVIRRAGLWLEDVQQRQILGSSPLTFEPIIAVADLLVELGLDHESIAAALLYKTAESSASLLAEIESGFGARIGTLVKGLTQMSALTNAWGSSDTQRHPQAERVRKMLLAMAEDARVVIIKLAERLHHLRKLDTLSAEAQEHLARQTIDVYAPLANRLGMWQIKWELEDLAFRRLEPSAYKDLAGRLAERRITRQRYIEYFIKILQAELKHAGIDAKITGRPKHIFGIWRKMKRTGQEFHQIYDKHAVRILVDEVSHCYAALGVVHAQWRYLPDQFDDYVATPKSNNYSSIHTAVLGPEEKVIEVQIRTHEMHQQAELGIAAHWRYKDNTTEDPSFDLKIAWLRQLLQWKAEIADASDWLDQFRSDIFRDRVYVLTPRGRVLDLPQGATPLDFAYHIHTEVGHRCRGAKVNGHIVPLNYDLNTGEKVEILTVRKGAPSRDWMNPRHRYLKTRKARSKVQQWFRQLDYDRNVAIGRASLEKELKRLGYAGVTQERLSQQLSYKRTDDLFAAIGRGEIKLLRIINAIRDISGYKRSGIGPTAPATQSTRILLQAPSGVRIGGVDNLVTRLAGCCHPIPADPIVGYITRGYGVTIHRGDCQKVLECAGDCPERIIEASWALASDGEYPVELEITAFDREGLARDIATILTNEKLNVITTQTYPKKAACTVTILTTFEIPNLTVLTRAISQIQRLPDVFNVRRAIH